MKTYHGCRRDDEIRVYFITQSGTPETLLPDASQEVRNKSPTGFNWGYLGSGPAQLALGLLLDACGDAAVAANLMNRFKSEVVCEWVDQWKITQVEILRWIIAHMQHA